MKALGGIYESGDRIDDQPTAGVPVHVSAEGGGMNGLDQAPIYGMKL